jgi:uncharacterized protein (TIGR04255 family)
VPSDPDTLPRFRKPPVDEVAVGVQFALPAFLPTHYGRFHECIKGEFPNVQVLPPLPPLVETFSGQAAVRASAVLPSLFGHRHILPRVLFVSRDDTSLIQLQSDRLYFNWRKREQGMYPHYDRFRETFSRVYTLFESFVADEGLGMISPFQCDVLYVNPLPEHATGANPSCPQKVFRTWNSNAGEEWQTPLEDLAFNARYKLLDETGEPFGRLIATMSTVPSLEGDLQMRLELTARGMPRGPGLSGVLAFHDAGHDAIVRCFAAITTQDMHERWGRYEHE